MRKWFPSEFTWRLYVVLQVACLILSVAIALDHGRPPLNTKGKLIYETIEVDPTKFAEAWVACERVPDEPKGFFGASPRDNCRKRVEDTRRRVVGREVTGIDFDEVYFVILALLILPFVVVRVPAWLWQGWREDRLK